MTDSGPQNPTTSVLIRKGIFRDIKTQTQRKEGHVKTEAEFREMHLKAKE